MLAGALALALFADAAVTQSAFTDSGRLSAEVSGAFQIGAITTAGTTVLPKNDVVVGRFPDRSQFVPGSTATLRMRVFNNSQSIPAALRITVTETDGLAGKLTYTATAKVDDHETTLFKKVPAKEVSTHQELMLAVRGEAPLVADATWDGAAKSVAEIEIVVACTDGTDPVDGTVTVRVAGESR